jgi:hypothetical protein
MKLNLLPTHVSKESATKVAWMATGIMSIAAVAAGIFAVGYSSTKLSEAKKRDDDAKPAYQAALDTSKKADDIMASSVVIDRNVKLAKAMNEHNTKYPDLFQEVLRYVPSFFRVNSISAAPLGADQCTVTMQGVMQSYQQYADVMLAMLRIPGATNVTRAGFTDGRATVPSLSEQDQVGYPVKPGEPPLPSDPRARLDELVARASNPPTGFQNIGGFGQPVDQKGAMPDWSLTTITVTLGRNIQTPNPRATLTSQGGAGGGQKPGTGGGFTPPNPQGPKTTQSSTTGGGGGK